MASVGGDVAGDDWDDFGVGIRGSRGRDPFRETDILQCRRTDRLSRLHRVLDYGQTGANASRRLVATNAETDGG